MASFSGLEARTRPPEPMRVLFKKYLKCTLEDIHRDHDVLCFASNVEEVPSRIDQMASLKATDLQQYFGDFMSNSATAFPLSSDPLVSRDASIYEVKALPGQLEFQWYFSRGF